MSSRTYAVSTTVDRPAISMETKVKKHCQGPWLVYTLVSYGLNAVRAYVLVHVTMATVHISHSCGTTGSITFYQTLPLGWVWRARLPTHACSGYEPRPQLFVDMYGGCNYLASAEW